MWPWASIFSVERGPTGSASLQDLWDNPRTCSEDTWGLAQRRPKAWEMPRGQEQLKGQSSWGLGTAHCCPSSPGLAVTMHLGTWGPEDRGQHGRWEEAPRTGAQGSWAA